MKLQSYSLMLVLALLIISCSNTGNVNNRMNSTVTSPVEYIYLNINEVVYFEFEKYDTLWTGTLTLYDVDSGGERQVQSIFYSAQDSTWDDFSEFVSFLDIYSLPKQYNIEGWVPDSGQLPKRVYSFVVFNGVSTHSYSYQDPIDDIRDYWQAQNVVMFTTYIQNELQWVQKGEDP